jgi:glycosyltransferase involved in cell wall biosynthesis
LSVFGVEPLRIGGTETYARELSVQLGRHGWRSVVCFVTPPPDEVRRFLELPDGSLELLGYLQGVDLRVASQLTQVLRRHKPRIVHFHYGGFLSPYPWLARLLSAEQVFFTDHGSRPVGHITHRASWPKRCVARAINWPLSKVICVSGYGYRAVCTRGLFPSERCAMIYNGVDLSRVAESPERRTAFRRRFAIPDGRAVVLQVSWLIPEKGIEDLLAAARAVIAQNVNAQFVIVGDGPFRARYTEKAIEMGLGDHVTWTGLIEDPFTAGAYDAADVVCQVSQWEEVFGWVIAEAMAYRKAVVATRVGGIPELVADGESGRLVERGDVEELARVLVTLLGDSAQRESMGTVGRIRVESTFDLEKNVAQLVALYGIGERPASSRKRPLR